MDEGGRARPETQGRVLLSGPLEQHGPHLPMGADLYQAAAVMDRVVRRVINKGWNVLIAPATAYTIAVLSRRYPGSVSVRRDHLVPYFIDVLDSFAANWLKQLVVFSQHLDPPHVLAWEEACRQAGHNTGARAIEGYEVLVVDDLRSGALRELFGKHGEGPTPASSKPRSCSPFGPRWSTWSGLPRCHGCRSTSTAGCGLPGTSASLATDLDTQALQVPQAPPSDGPSFGATHACSATWCSSTLVAGTCPTG